MTTPKSRESLGSLYVKHYKKWYLILLSACVIALLAFAIDQIETVQEIELKTMDYRFVQFPITSRSDTNIVLVAIDKNSLDFFSDNGISYPWPRDFYAHAMNYFSAVGARTVLFDMLFYEPDLRRAETDPEETDGAFAQAIQRAGNVVLGAEMQFDSSSVPKKLSAFAINIKGDSIPQSHPYSGIELPIDTLLQATESIGVTNIKPDPDGIIRRVRLLNLLNGKYYPNLALSASLTDAETNSIRVVGQSLLLGDNKIPLQPDGNYFINWYGKGGPNGVFKYVPFSAVIQSASAKLTGNTPSLSDQVFAGKDVFIGASAPGLLDLKPTPFTEYSVYPGMEIWATILSNLRHADFVHFLPAWMNLLNTILVSFLVIVIFSRLEMKWSNPLMLLVLGYIFGVALLAWQGKRTAVNITIPLIGFVLSYVYIATVSYVVEGRSKREIRKVFSRYVHPDVIQNLMKDPELVQMGGDEIYATVLFSDIYNFTTFSEGRTAPELVKYLNEYFDRLTSFVLDHNGLLDKYTGDGIMALFGAPLPRDDHALLACQAALAHRDYSLQLQEDDGDLTPAAHFHLNTRIGMNSGPIVAGNIGSERRTDYTAIGDDVNLAARLEGVNKVFKTKIIVSESTHDLVEEEFIFRELDLLRVKGKTMPVKIYELVDSVDSARDKDYSWIPQYEEALSAYRAAEWKKAVKLFTELAEGTHKDSASQTMLERCELLKKDHPEAWDGIFTLMSK